MDSIHLALLIFVYIEYLASLSFLKGSYWYIVYVHTLRVKICYSTKNKWGKSMYIPTVYVPSLASCTSQTSLPHLAYQNFLFIYIIYFCFRFSLTRVQGGPPACGFTHSWQRYSNHQHITVGSRYPER